MSTTRIVIADDHPVILDGLTSHLGRFPEIEVVAVFTDGSLLLDFLTQHRVHVVVADINMPGKDGISCTRIIKARYPDTKVLILTMYNDRTFLKALIDAGADGCLLKSKSTEEVKTAIDRVMSGKNYFDDSSQFKDAPRASDLSERELQVIRLMLQNQVATDIAEQLNISIHTVKTHIKNIYRKTNAHNHADLANYVLNHHLLS
jgi:DNA-binding NarL/FixJ family response regulator